MMSYLTKSARYCSKCYLPPLFIVRGLKVQFRKKYVQRKRESTLNASGAHLQVLGSGAQDQPASVILQARDKRYLFNCGEGIGRLCTNAGISLKKVEHAFFTQSKWNCIGGITSLMFATIASNGHLPIFHGPKNLFKIAQRMSFLSIIGGIYKHRFTEANFHSDERFEDHKLVIEPIELKHSQDTAMIYMCKLKECRGRFSLEKSIDKDVPGPLLVKLFRGEDVTLDDGTIVTPNDVRHSDSAEIFFIGDLFRHFI